MTVSDNQALEDLAQSIAADSGATETVDLPSLDLPPSGDLRLPGGYISGLDIEKTIYEAQVRELTGLDEELIEKARRSNRIDRFLNAVLVAGVETVGGKVAYEDTLDGLLLGDRDFLIMEIRRATYGSTIDYPTLVCPQCGKDLDVSLPIDDIPIKRFDHSGQRYFDVALKNGGTAECRLATGADSAFVFDQDAETNAEVNTLLLSRCVVAIVQQDGTREAVAGSLPLVRNFGIQDRKKILAELDKRQPGPQYADVKVTHDLCGKEVPFVVNVGDMFPDL